MEKSCGKCALKASPTHLSFLILVNNPKQPLPAKTYFENMIF